MPSRPRVAIICSASANFANSFLGIRLHRLQNEQMRLGEILLAGIIFADLLGCARAELSKTPISSLHDRSIASDSQERWLEYKRIPIVTSPIDIPSQILIECTIDNVEHVLLRLDTAAPNTSLPPEQLSALGLSLGTHDVWIGDKANGVHIGNRYISSIPANRLGPISGPGIPSGAILRGTAGTNLLQGYAVGLDFQGRSLWVIQRSAPNSLEVGAIPHPFGVEKPISVQAELKTVDPNEGGVLFVNASFDDRGSAGSFLIDTGANTNLALSAYWGHIHQASSKSVPLDLADYRGAVISGAYHLGWSLTLYGQLIVKPAPVWVLDDFPVLRYEGQHFQHAIDGLIGLWGIYSTYTVLDFGASGVVSSSRPRLFFFPYARSASLEEREFTGFSFTVHKDGRAVQVVSGGDAEQQGVHNGDLLIDPSDGRYRVTDTGVVVGSPGETRSFRFKRGEKILSATLTAKQLLHP